MAATQLQVYEQAIQALGETAISALTDNRSIRYELDKVWDSNGREYCLELGLWNFAMRTAEVSYDPDVGPSYGYQYGFSKPDDWLRTAAFCSDEYFREPIVNYEDEGGYLYCDLDTVYWKFVSKDSSYGLDLSRWPATFTQYVAHYFASRIAPYHTKDKDALKMLAQATKMALREARSKDAMDEPAKFPAGGSWARSRSQGRSLLERGSRSSFTG